MKIASMVKTSFVDYEPHIACVVFTKGCNMTCAYCHNDELNKVDEFISEEDVIEFLTGRAHLLDGIVISGGEPTLQAGLTEFIKRCKKLGLLVKLDTNGTNPKLLRALLEDELVDYVAMDIKAGQEDYRRISGVDYQLIEESKDLLIQSGRYEFRTTLFPELSKDAIRKLCKEYEQYNYYIQQYRQTDTSRLEPFDETFLEELQDRYHVKVRK